MCHSHTDGLLISHQVFIVLEKGVNFPPLCVKVHFLRGDHCIPCPSWLPFLTDTEAAGRWPASLLEGHLHFMSRDLNSLLAYEWRLDQGENPNLLSALPRKRVNLYEMKLGGGLKCLPQEILHPWTGAQWHCPSVSWPYPPVWSFN